MITFHDEVIGNGVFVSSFPGHSQFFACRKTGGPGTHGHVTVEP